MLGMPEAALAHFADFRRIEPNSPFQHYAFNWEGGAHLQMGDLAAAEAAYECGIALNPEASYGHFNKALVVGQLGRTSEALQLMLEARRREPTATQELWELRLRRWFHKGPALEASLASLRALWPETEGAA